MSLLERLLHQSQPFGSREQEVLLLLQVAAQRTWEPWARFLKAAGLTPNQYNVLRILRGATAEGIRCGEIAQRMITRDPDITRLVDRLIARGLAERAVEPADRRSVRVRITPPGRELLTGLDEEAERMPRSVMARVPSAQLEQLHQLLENLIPLTAGDDVS